jgi:uncharacterized protein
MGRIQEAYERKFRQLLAELGARQIEHGVAWLNSKARAIADTSGYTFERTLETVYRRLHFQLDQYLARVGKLHHPPAKPAVVKFVCDAGLGGLARWLRASGYEAHWTQDITDDALMKEAEHFSATLLTTDSGLMERRLLRDGIIPAIWVSPSLETSEQLTHVLEELKLPILQPRCMACAGELIEVPKEHVADRIPPRTLRWLDQYFECQSCGKLFWHGTHWQHIRERLKAINLVNPARS